MIAGDTVDTSWLDWAVAESAHPSETLTGDAALVRMLAGGALIAVVDGLGHGREAAEAAKIAIDTVAGNVHEPIIELVRACHEALRGSRGCVLTLVSIDRENGTLDWIGVGNVEAAVFWAGNSGSVANDRLVQRGGVVGYKLPPLNTSSRPFRAGSVLALATDGLREGFTDDVALNDPAAFSVERLLERHLLGTDDALVLVARNLRGVA